MAQKEHIERESVLALIHEIHIPEVGYRHRCIDPQDVREIPSADVRPAVRGHWITEEEAEEKGNYLLRDACSVCGHCDWDNTESKYFNYCPNCGADMREES